MAPLNGHLLVPKLWRIVEFGISKSTAIIKSKLPQSSPSSAQYSLQPIRVYAQNQPIHPIAYLKQSRSSNPNRWFSSSTRSYTASGKHQIPRYDRSQFPVSNVSKTISQRGAAPFASTLRPNLTGGTLLRSAGGYGLGGAGARQFSHTSSAQTQVVQNVSAGIRAFFIGGGKARFDGVDPITGEKRYRSVSNTEDAVYAQWENPLSKSERGTNLEFKLSPTITALSPVFSSSSKQSTSNINSINDLNLLDNLTTDFARALGDLAAILTDLRTLSTFGDLPISLTTTSSGPLIRVHFPGCDGDLVSRLCDQVGIRRGIIVEDDAWDTKKDVEMALLFPFAPAGDVDTAAIESDDAREYFEEKKWEPEHRQADELEWHHMLSPVVHTPPRTLSSYSRKTVHSPLNNKTYTSSGYDNFRESDIAPDDPYDPYDYSPSLKSTSHSTTQSTDYDGLEGIYKFLQECEDSRR